MKRVIIIGGGFGGFYSSLALQKIPNIQTVLIDPTDYFLYIPLIHEVSVGEIPKSIPQIPYKNTLQGTIHIKSKAKKIILKEKIVQLDNDRTISWDYLIIAPGSLPNLFIKGTENKLTLNNLDDAIKIRNSLRNLINHKENSIGLIGEGPTGIELASEIAELLNKLNLKVEIHQFMYFKRYFRDDPPLDIMLKRRMRKLGVKIHPGEPVREVINKKIITEKNEYELDVIFVCTGVKPVLIESELDFKNGYPVDDYCLVKGYKSVYAIGDASLYQKNGNKLPNLAQVAEKQAKYIVFDICRRIHNKKRKKFDPQISGILISAGKYFAIGRILNILILKGFLAWFAKRSLYFLKIFLVKRKFNLIKHYIISCFFPNKFFII
ncbi:MAG: hypothetical protein GF329_00120 [Candidatus Lokiarchaeota archaeon]|nr:hypothetical protein [Candidatus Lokiarchaeota archaeon]